MDNNEIKKFSLYLIFLTIGAICLFAAVFIPYNEIRMTLAVFGMVVVIGYVIMIYHNIYSPMKRQLDQTNKNSE